MYFPVPNFTLRSPAREAKLCPNRQAAPLEIPDFDGLARRPSRINIRRLAKGLHLCRF
jgi:hypothetical protein